jgi:hypothetical protein
MSRITTVNGVEILGISAVTKPMVRTASVKPRTPPAATKPATKAATKPVTKPAPAAKVATKSAAKVKVVKDKAAKAASHAVSTGNKLTKLHPGMSKMLKSAGASLQSKATKIKGDVIGDEVDEVEVTSPSVEKMAAAGDIATQIIPYIDQLNAAGQTDLAHEGEMIVNSANYLITSITQMIQMNRTM